MPIMIVLIIVVAVIPAFYFYKKYQKSQALLKNPTQAAEEEIKVLMAKVGRLVELPSGEEPTVATVSDKEKLKDQPFFTKSENGDKVLIYTNAKKAVLYRPATNKVIDIAPINIGPSTATVKPEQTTSPQPVLCKLALYNGTSVVGLTKTAEKQLKADLEVGSLIEVVLKENAKSSDYKTSLVIDLNGDKKEEAMQLAKILKGEVGELPDEEIKPEADILVILGSAYIEKE